MYSRLNRHYAIQCFSDNSFFVKYKNTKCSVFPAMHYFFLMKEMTIAGRLGLKLVLFYYSDRTAKERIHKKCFERKI